jgi:Zn-dependent protease
LQSAALIIGLFEFVLLIFSLSFHECSHAWMASRLGDQTARLEGRVTLNPMYHIDPVGTLLFPAIIIFGPFFGMSMFSGALVGWAKPTPVISRNFKKIRRDENMVTLAGPVSNLLLAGLALFFLMALEVGMAGGRELVLSTFQGGILQGVGSGLQAAVLLAVLAIDINISLFFFNLLPIPPLDGSALVRNLLPYNAMQFYDRIPYWVSWLLMILVGGTILRMLIGPAMAVVYFVLTRV